MRAARRGRAGSCAPAPVLPAVPSGSGIASASTNWGICLTAACALVPELEGWDQLCCGVHSVGPSSLLRCSVTRAASCTGNTSSKSLLPEASLAPPLGSATPGCPLSGHTAPVILPLAPQVVRPEAQAEAAPLCTSRARQGDFREGGRPRAAGGWNCAPDWGVEAGSCPGRSVPLIAAGWPSWDACLPPAQLWLQLLC